MSNPTELTDLDRLEALARAATPGPWSWWTSNSILRLSADDGIDGGVLHAYSHRGYADICCGESDRAFIAAANPAAVLALIELARRAQPEGEAPQADTIDTPEFRDLLHTVQALFIGDASAAKAALIAHIDARIAPAAQHAESGALEAELKRRMATYAAGHEAAVEYLRSELEKARAALTAQSQDTGLLKLALEQAKSRIAQADARIEELEAAQSQGAQPSLAALDQAWKLGLKADVDGWADLRAQQAAAPGALAVIPVSAIQEIVDTKYPVSRNDYTSVNSILKKLEAAIAAAPSAPGTPEAPGLPGQTDEEAYAGSGYHHVMSLDTFKTFRREYENRAAQLDGGQGDGA
ncbi:hypothetical protein ACFOHT_10050 [Massilia oculi]|uniref:Ead/Ea22-like family protein n=1 Tax=Massilia oculi TaxID=945844 RepID=A0A2S2DFV6_9BURK|nr:hypothetical protein [Massilia oculi]AWL04263.1 hypothetical protein DIR46_07330 [Massilia oculi]